MFQPTRSARYVPKYKLMNIASGHDWVFLFGLAETLKEKEKYVNTTVNADKAVYFTAGGVVSYLQCAVK